MLSRHSVFQGQLMYSVHYSLPCPDSMKMISLVFFHRYSLLCDMHHPSRSTEKGSPHALHVHASITLLRADTHKPHRRQTNEGKNQEMKVIYSFSPGTSSRFSQREHNNVISTKTCNFTASAVVHTRLPILPLPTGIPSSLRLTGS